MRSAVFTKDKMIQGFLEHKEYPPSYRSFVEWVRIGVQPRHDRISLEKTAVTAERVTFTWDLIGSNRDAPGEVYFCKVLIADRPDLLGRVRGFKWFAEEFGERAPLTSSAIG